MAQTNAAKLYTPDVLALAVTLADFPLKHDSSHQADARSPTCGSTITVGMDCDESGLIASIGLSVSACAIGQASAAIMAQNVIGRDQAWVRSRQNEIETWLSGAKPTPNIPSFDLLDTAKHYPARHGAILLPWRAVTAALSNEGSAS